MDYPVGFNIILWTMVVLILVVIGELFHAFRASELKLFNFTGFNCTAPPSSREPGLSESRNFTIETKGINWVAQTLQEHLLIHPFPANFGGTGLF